MRCEVELDIFSGMPNPTWTLTDAEAATFTNVISTLPPASGTELSGSLGYRGMIIECSLDGAAQTIHIQAGIVQIASGTTKAYAYDVDRKLERWLRDTARPHLNGDLLELIDRELR